MGVVGPPRSAPPGWEVAGIPPRSALTQSLRTGPSWKQGSAYVTAGGCPGWGWPQRSDGVPHEKTALGAEGRQAGTRELRLQAQGRPPPLGAGRGRGGGPPSLAEGAGRAALALGVRPPEPGRGPCKPPVWAPSLQRPQEAKGLGLHFHNRPARRSCRFSRMCFMLCTGWMFPGSCERRPGVTVAPSESVPAGARRPSGGSGSRSTTRVRRPH